jgi:alanine dehydrogenase
MDTKNSGVKIIVQSCANRCFTDKEFLNAGIEVKEDISHCDILMGIKEVPAQKIIPGKTYYIFSHTKKLQLHNKIMLQAFIKNKVTLVDYECLEHEDGTRVLGFGFFAGIVGAHNGMMAYGKRTTNYNLERVNSQKDFRHLIHTYFGLKIPNIKIAVTGNGRVAHGVLEVMNLLGIHETETDLFINKKFTYPVYVHLKAADLYAHKKTGKYNREEFHTKPGEYKSMFDEYISVTDILMNGVYWEKNIPRLFEIEELKSKKFNIQTIADVSDDKNGSVPCNFRDSTIENPVYGVDKKSYKLTEPYLPTSVDVMAVSNLPNELPRDASRYFGDQIIKDVLKDIITGDSPILKKATILQKGKLTKPYEYMKEYAGL